jgi:multidrug efflux pump subunit AcrB
MNIMTLGGLALAVGVLVDVATVSIESIYTHLSGDTSRVRAILLATTRTAGPRLLAMLCVLAVFLPSFFMVGVGQQLFVPLSLAVGFAMLAAYVLSSTLVPVLAAWMLKAPAAHSDRDGYERLRRFYERVLQRVVAFRVIVIPVYLVLTVGFVALVLPRLGTEIFPTVDTGQFQIRMRAPTGTRIERTETLELRALDVINRIVGADNVLISTAFIGVQPASYPINTIYLFTSGPQEAVIKVALKPGAPVSGEDLKERLRSALTEELPTVTFSFEAADIISQVMSFGSPTPIEVAVQGPDFTANRAYATKVHDVLATLPFLRDLQFGQPMDYPTMRIDIDRERAGQLGLTTASVARSLVAATSSSRFVEPNYWRDPASGNAFQIQVEVPQYRLTSPEDIEGLPVARGTSGAQTLVGDVAQVSLGTTLGLVERYNMQRVVSLTANIHGLSLGAATRQIQAALAHVGEAPRGVSLNVRGQVPALQQTVSGLRTGLLLAVGVIFLLLAANYQSFKMALAVLSTVPAVLCGVLILLIVTRTTLNIQSFMGSIMAIGIAMANSILLVTFAETSRRTGQTSVAAAVQGAGGRLRAILMTAAAMIAGMIPMAIGLGEGGQESAPLGRAVVGGLLFATVATLFVLPSVYAVLQGRALVGSPSLDPDDPESRYHEAR